MAVRQKARAVSRQTGKTKNGVKHTASKSRPNTKGGNDTSDQAMLALLEPIKQASNAEEIRRLSDQLEQVIFHKQFKDA